MPISIAVTTDLLLTPRKVLAAFDTRSYAELIRIPEFQSLMRTAPEHGQCRMWGHILDTVPHENILNTDQRDRVLLSFIQSPHSFDVREVAAHPDTFCPEQWLRVQLLGELDRWFTDPKTLPRLRTSTSKTSAYRVARWTDDDGASKKVFLSNGRMHSELVRLLRRACFRGMHAGQYEALVRFDVANALYPIKLTLPAAPAALPSHLLNWPLANAMGIERTVFDYVRQKGMANLQQMLAIFRRTPIADAATTLDTTAEYSTLSSRTRTSLANLITCLREAIYAPEWLEDISDAELTAMFKGAKHTARPAFPQGGRKLDTRRMYFAAFANARTSIDPYATSYLQARDSYEAWAAEDLALLATMPAKPKAFLRGLLDRVAARLSMTVVPGTGTDPALIGAVAWLWYLVWLSPRLADTPTLGPLRDTLDMLSAELAAHLGASDDLLHEADHLLHAPLRTPCDVAVRLPLRSV